MFSIGDTVYKGTVRRSLAANFDQFAAALCSVSVVSCSTADYEMMDRDGRQSAKSTRFFTPGHYEASPAQKKSEEPATFSLLCLDVDDASDAMNWVGEGVGGRLPWAHLIYHTLSSTPALPRVRILVGCTTTPASQYARCVRWFADLLGMTPTKESLSPAFAMYWPSVFPDSKASPIISRSSGSLVDTADIPADASPVRSYGFGATSGTVTGVSLTHAESAIRSIPADCSYADWLSVCCGLRHQFSSSEDEAKSAFDLFDCWSATGKGKYAGTDRSYAMWASVGPVGKARTITMRTVIQMAVAHQWDASGLRQDTYDVFKDRIKAATLPAQIENGVIAELAVDEILTTIELQSLAHGISAKLLALGRNATTAVVVKAVKERRAELKTPAAPPTNWCSQLAYVATLNAWLDTGVPFPERMTTAAMDLHYSTRETGGTKASEFAIKNGAMNVQTDVYDPRTTESVVRLSDTAQALNTYKASYAPADPRMAAEAGSRLREHLAYLFHDEWHQTALVDWMAWALRNPGEKVMWAPVIQGVQGCGKSVIAEMLGGCYGLTNVFKVSTDLLNNQWTDYVFGKQLLVFEEIDATGPGVGDKLKMFITSSDLILNQKHRGSRNAPNYVNCMFFMNNLTLFPVDPNERRYFVLRCQQQEKCDLTKGRDYWDRMYELTNRLAGGLRHYLLTCPISDTFDPKAPAPVTVFKASAAAINESPDIEALKAAAAAGTAGIFTDRVSEAAAKALLGNSTNIAMLMGTRGWVSTSIAGDRIWHRHGVKVVPDPPTI